LRGGAFERMGILAWKSFASVCGLTYPWHIQELAKRIPSVCERTLGKLAGTGLDETILLQIAELVGQRTEQATSRLSTPSR
jgi:hypothetical protein